MKWNRISKTKPPIDKKILVAYGFIFTTTDCAIEGYGLITFSSHDLQHLSISRNGLYCFYKGDTAISFWCEIKEPKL